MFPKTKTHGKTKLTSFPRDMILSVLLYSKPFTLTAKRIKNDNGTWGRQL